MKDHSVELVRVTRGDATEEVHRGSIVLLQDGEVVGLVGHSDCVAPARSTAKPFQILPLLEGGGREKFRLQLDDIAVMVSSHNGEPSHVQQVRSLLLRGEFSEVDLQCGVHPPYYSWVTRSIYQSNDLGPQPIHNNCSGKHAGMLLLCALEGFGTANYWRVEHPAQQLILQAVARSTEVSVAEMTIALDGCGVPTYCMSIRSLALAYQKLALEVKRNNGSALSTVGNSMLAHPFMVAGTDRVETELMQLKPIIAKSGSSGVFCLAVPELEMGIAIKMESGSEDASECVAVAVLAQLGILNESSLGALSKYIHIPVRTWTGFESGRYEPIFDLGGVTSL